MEVYGLYFYPTVVREFTLNDVEVIKCLEPVFTVKNMPNFYKVSYEDKKNINFVGNKKDIYFYI